MRDGKISVSVMCTDLVNLKVSICIFEKESVDYIRCLRRLMDIPLNLHLMTRSLEYKRQWIGIKEHDIISIHYESTYMEVA